MKNNSNQKEAAVSRKRKIAIYLDDIPCDIPFSNIPPFTRTQQSVSQRRNSEVHAHRAHTMKRM
jgi:hypothetical protein